MSRLAPIGTFSFIVGLLFVTSYPAIGWWDSGAYVLVSEHLSLPFPGGSVLLVVLGWLLTKALFFLPTAKAVIGVNILATAGAAVCLYFIMLRIVDRLNPDRSTYRTIIAVCTALSLPLLYSVWQEAHVSRAYPLGLLFTGCLVYSSITIWLSDDTRQKTRHFIWICCVMGLDYSAHRLNTPFIAFMPILVLTSFRSQLRSPKFWMAAGGAYLAGVAVHLYLLIRGQSLPLLDMGYVQTWSDLWTWIRMNRYGDSSIWEQVFHRRAEFWSFQFNFMYLRYFQWNFVGPPAAGGAMAGIPLLLGLAGFFYQWKRDRRLWIPLTALFAIFSIILVFYLNVRDGFHDIREIDRLFLASFFVFLIWAGIGLAAIVQGLNRLFETLGARAVFATTVVGIVGTVLLPLNLLQANLNACDKSNFHYATDWAHNILNTCAPNAILFTNGDNDTFPLWYLQYVEGVRQDVAVVNLPLLNTDFYIEQLGRAPFSLNFSKIPEEFQFRDNVDSVVVQIPLTAASDTLTVTIPGRKQGEKRVLMAQDQVLYDILQENADQQPIYFSVTCAQNNLRGLQDYLTLEGLAWRLQSKKDKSVDIARMERNLLTSYRYRGFRNTGQPIDRETQAITQNYREGFLELADACVAAGKRQNAQDVIGRMHTLLPARHFSDKRNDVIAKREYEIYQK